ncbi:dimethylglycine dehydrogenase [Rhodoligotrophos appendicifer]|uniref:GcvT family protein n=1 Tax=Rhodoligotrophos appendicifer TaxID=987056 RepID=UPI0011864B8C|nr:FAD-dependent oxidoreductase [Rhodoligotrophos appendicifer]
MQSHARVVVIGGGCVGAAILYGLAKKGWSDIALLERTQLTAGSTWHAAGLLVSYGRSHNFGRMVSKTLEIYGGLHGDTGQDIGLHICGQLRVANTKTRLDEFRSYIGIADAQGIRAHIVSPAEIRELAPLLEGNRTMLGGLYHPDDGHVAPADVTQAMAKGARDRGAKIYLNTEARAFEQLGSGEWRVTTNQGTITCEHLVLATGNYARQTAAKVGLDLPAIPIIHQYWVTEAIPQIIERKRKGLPEMPILRDEAYAGYLREEGDGLMFGPYETVENLKLFAVDGVPEWFGADLLPEDFDAVAANWDAALNAVPALANAGIKSNVRGPFQMTPDELPLAGPAWGLNNLWLAEGVPGGILWGGTLGHYLAEWIVEGGTSVDMSEIDPRRFGAYANKAWTKLKVQEAWGTHADLHFPGEDLAAARPAKTAPSYDLLGSRGAVWGVMNGWEIPRWYAPEGVEAVQDYSHRQTKHGIHVAAEVAAVRNGVGFVELTPMTKFEVSGPGASAWLDRILANRLPSVGRICLAHQLSPKGTVLAEYTVTRLGEEFFYLVSTPRAQRHNFDLLRRSLPSDVHFSLRDVTDERGCFTIVGPHARDLLQTLTEVDLSNSSFPWLAAQVGDMGLAGDVRFLRINYEGELGWEIYHPLPYQRMLLQQVLDAGEAYGLRLVGVEALESLRLEKSYRAMYRDMNPALTALESGLHRFIHFDKGDFIGRDALLSQKNEGGPSRRLVPLSIAPGGDASVIAHESVSVEGRLTGRVTSGGYSYHFGRDLAMALIESRDTRPGTQLEVNIFGEQRDAVVIEESPYDPGNERSRL